MRIDICLAIAGIGMALVAGIYALENWQLKKENKALAKKLNDVLDAKSNITEQEKRD